MDWTNKFWTGVFSDPDGTPSFARIGTGFLMCAVVGWDCGYMTLAWMWNTRHLIAGQPALPLLPDPLLLAAQAAFFTVLYGANKFAAIMQK